LELDRGRADIAKTTADAGKVQGETVDSAFKRYRGILDFIDTPQAAARWLQAQYNDPTVGPILQAIRPYEEAVQGIPANPQQYAQWRVQAGVGMEKVQQWAKERELAAQQSETTRRGQDMTAATARAGQAVTVRGQNMADARAKESNTTQRELLVQEKGLKVAEMEDKAAERKRTKEAGIAATANQIGVIDKALTHPGRETATGLSSALDPRNFVPGTDAADFRAVLDQIGGTAFLQAFESLKGGGQITEVEGKKATEAIARLNRAQSDAEFKKSLNDLRQVMTTGYKRLSGKDYGGQQSSGDVPQADDKPQAGAFSDAEKERRYQEWKARQK
jgi:hypothetical protein